MIWIWYGTYFRVIVRYLNLRLFLTATAEYRRTLLSSTESSSKSKNIFQNRFGYGWLGFYAYELKIGYFGGTEIFIFVSVVWEIAKSPLSLEDRRPNSESGILYRNKLKIPYCWNRLQDPDRQAVDRSIDRSDSQSSLTIHMHISQSTLRHLTPKKAMQKRSYANAEKRREIQEDGKRGDFTDPLKWWKHHLPRFPILGKMARKHLCIPVTSAPSRRFFSVAVLIISKLRSRLNMENTSCLVCVSDVWDTYEDCDLGGRKRRDV